jgi:hypothetical protein
MDFVWAGTLARPKMACPTLANIPIFAYFFLGFGGNGITFSVIEWNLFLKC